ncbi:SAM-dependent methyltransferase [Lentzea tibetensis]|uniref:SAM-dependent methyltransferase n=2 Tax=Lentzea tibetensis TaxID=2591470 RepID=A0A563ETK6_9PSEU|nr:SAM-dependent methyltransferase [Lentzea tibetensis]
MVRHSSPLDPVTASLLDRTAELGHPALMQVPAEQATLLTLLTSLTGATVAIDVGTFTGLSALSMARGLAPGGRVITCDVTDDWGIAREHWEKAGLTDVIDFRVGPALETLRSLPADLVVDIAFLDADKDNYENYYRLLHPRLRSGGLLLVDNVLFNGYVMAPDYADPGVMRDSAHALAAFNSVLAADESMDVVILPISDGLTVARKK